jgi:hypothetical protein
VDVLARPRHHDAAREQQARHVGAEPDRQLVQPRVVDAADRARREPQHRGGVGRAAAHAGSDRDPLGDRDPLRLGPAGRFAERRKRGGGEVWPVDAGTDDLVGLRRHHRQLVGERHGLDDRDERVQAVLARGADEQRQVHLARGTLGHDRRP